jgi:exopolyphosphatase/pppGpp-phosphohydrolase
MGASETWLHIGDAALEVAQEAAVVLRIGSATLAATHFHHDPPTPLEVEKAIAAVEDEIARVHAAIARGSRLYTRDGVVRELALDAGVAPGAQMVFAVEAVENAFQRLLPMRAIGKEKAAVLLILRELMHHLGFAAIVVRAPG